jgi:2',3'-cyclic-nucleotide 2'-phosphodiesterase (5'-nucleotidase family)
VKELLDKYSEQVSVGTNVLGQNAIQRPGSTLCQLAAQLYYEAGVEIWGDEYDIALGGGFFSIRSPYNLAAGDVTYGQLQTLFPFDNELVLCSIKGRDLLERFIHTDNDRYYIAYGDNGDQIRNNIQENETYYIIVDSYTSIYGPNKLTEIERYNEKVYARDLLAEYVKAGGLS